MKNIIREQSLVMSDKKHKRKQFAIQSNVWVFTSFSSVLAVLTEKDESFDSLFAIMIRSFSPHHDGGFHYYLIFKQTWQYQCMLRQNLNPFSCWFAETCKF